MRETIHDIGFTGMILFLNTFCKENFYDEICDWKNSVFTKCETIHCEMFELIIILQ